MKKLLLTLATVAMCGFVSYAADVTLQVKDATDIKGTLNEEKPAGEGSQYGEAKNYKPLESLKLGDYTFTFSLTGEESAPAYYYPTSTNPNGATTIRLYGGKSAAAGNKMTVKCPAGKTMKSLTLDCSQADDGAEVNASVGTATTASKKVVWTNNEAVSEVTLTIHKQTRFTAVTISDEEGGVTPPPATGVTFVKATALETGSYVFVCDGKLGTPAAAGVSYGRISLVDATIDGDKVKTDEANAFEITVADGKATIKDAEGRFYSMDDNHFTSFQFYKDENQYNYWTFAFDGDKVKFTNAVNTDCIICQSKGNEGKFYTNIAPAKAPAEFNLPVLYKKAAGSGVANIAVENNGEAVYYNLQGVRVENPVKGLYIVVKGGKSQKVIL